VNINDPALKQSIHNFIFGENNRPQNSIRYFRKLRAGAPLLNSTQTFTTPNQERVWGIDISGRWDGNVTFDVTRLAGADFAIIKCIDGAVPTRLWRENRTRALAAGLIVGEYAWLYPDNKVSCVAQARAVWELIKNEPKQLPLTIDFEWTRYAGVAANPTYDDLNKWVTEFTRLSGYKPGFYSAAGYMNTLGTMPRPLLDKFIFFWVANYGVAAPTMPLGFFSSDWDFWQFAATGDATLVAPNDTGKLETDLNYWHSDLTSLKALAGITEVLPPPDEPEEGTNMSVSTWHKVITAPTVTLQIRNGPGTSYMDVGDLLPGDIVEAIETIGGWHHIDYIYRGGQSIPCPAVAWCSAAYTSLTTSPVTPPEPTPAHVVEVTVDGVVVFRKELA
jgi:GH25 family lysozyme M1 (1,4-beta-N-acetylmuramidase)